MKSCARASIAFLSGIISWSVDRIQGPKLWPWKASRARLIRREHLSYPSNESHPINHKSYQFFFLPWADVENNVCISKQLAFLSEPCTRNSPCIIFIAKFLRVISTSISLCGISVEHTERKGRVHWHYKDTERRCSYQQFSHGTHSHIQWISEGFYGGKTAGG